MKRNMLLIVSIIAIVWIGPANAFGQGRGRGIGLGRKSDVFVNSHDARSGRWDGRGRQIGSRTILVVPRNRGRGIGLARKSRFINGHDARSGRFDGRGPWHGLQRHDRRYRRTTFFETRPSGWQTRWMRHPSRR